MAVAMPQAVKEDDVKGGNACVLDVQVMINNYYK